MYKDLTVKEKRVIYQTSEYEDFYNNADENVQNKIDYIKDIIINENIIKSHFVCKLTNTVFYELRIVLKNPNRVILFTLDHEDINQATEILFINGFIKKSTKDYKKQIKNAIKILEQWTDQ